MSGAELDGAYLLYSIFLALTYLSPVPSGPSTVHSACRASHRFCVCAGDVDKNSEYNRHNNTPLRSQLTHTLPTTRSKYHV